MRRWPPQLMDLMLAQLGGALPRVLTGRTRYHTRYHTWCIM
jgi:hypothetical protein